MESAPVPPLFCSTPPPIDPLNDDEDILDDNEFAIATDIDESKSTAAATPTADFTPLDTARLEDCCYIPSSSPPPFDLTAEEPPTPDDNANIVEAINFDSIHKYEECGPPRVSTPPPPLEEPPNSPLESESISAPSTCPSSNDNRQDEPSIQPTDDARHKREAFCGLISVEDVSDESDSEHLRNGCGSLSLEEDDPNFYRIEVVDQKASASPPPKEWQGGKLEPSPREEDGKNVTPSINVDEVKEVPPETLCSLDSFDDDSEWGDVQFSSASVPEVPPPQIPDIQPPAATTATTTMTINDVCFDKAFDNAALAETANESPPRDIDDSGGDVKDNRGDGDRVDDRVDRVDDVPVDDVRVDDRVDDHVDDRVDDIPVDERVDDRVDVRFDVPVDDGVDDVPFDDRVDVPVDVPVDDGVFDERVNDDEVVKEADEDDDDFDDDEFGDFAAASTFEAPVQKPPPLPAQQQQQQITQSQPSETNESCSKLESATTPAAEANPYQAPKLSLEQVKPLLASIFPVEASSSEESAPAYPKPPNRLPMESVDSASALNYQWKHSETRSCLIRSLGIDSRNILYAEKWNPSMPRFAANLSFDPIQPLKPQSNAAETSVEPSIQIPLKPQVNTDLKETIPMDSLTEKLSEASLNPSPSIASDTLEPMPATSVPVEDIHLDTAKIPAKPANAVDPNYMPFDEPSPFEAVAAYQQQPPPHLDLGGKTLTLPLEDYASAAADRGDMVPSPTTFSVPLKETHIFTPSKHDETIAVTLSAPAPLATPPKAEPIDFDYEKAAAGIIIDETVVKKEYRDIEYNPGFSLELSTTTMTSEVPTMMTSDVPTMLTSEVPTLMTSEVPTMMASEVPSMMTSEVPTMMTSEVPAAAAMFVDRVAFESAQLEVASSVKPVIEAKPKPLDVEDEFCEFQSVPPPPAPAAAAQPEMILCPSILLPKALALDQTVAKPKVEWGDSVANINPDELARIEELFSQQSNRNGAATQQQPQVGHLLQPKPQQSPTISGRVARKEHAKNVPTDEDDDWSDFLSVPVASVNTMPKIAAPPGRSGKLPNLPTPQKAPEKPAAAEDEWSDFVSSGTANGQPFYGGPNNNNNNNKYLQNKTHHIVHDFSTFPAPQQQPQHLQPQHHNHHQQLQQHNHHQQQQLQNHLHQPQHHNHHQQQQLQNHLHQPQHHNHHQHHPHHNQSIAFHNPSSSMPRKLMPNISVIPTLGFSNIMSSSKSGYTTKK